VRRPRRTASFALRGGALAAQALGMNKVVSEDALRRALLVANLLARERPLDSKQMRLDLASPSVHECGKLWEYAVYVTDVDYPLESIAQLYRDRAAVGKAASHANQTTLYLTNAASMVAAWALRAHRLAAGE